MSISISKIVENFNTCEHNRMLAGKKIDKFRAGDVVKIEYSQANHTKLASFEGIVIKSTKKKHMSSVTVAKMSSHGIQIVRTFLFCHKTFASLTLVRSANRHRQARVYYKVLKHSKV